MKTGLERVIEERQEQLMKHNRSVERDVSENIGRKILGGVEALIGNGGDGDYSKFPPSWDSAICKKMAGKEYEDRIILAAALLVAEYDRVKAMQKKAASIV